MDWEKEAEWLIENPDFEERPATIREFLGEGYLNIASGVRPGVLKALEDIFGTDVQSSRIASYEKAMVTGAIGIGKTTFASIVLPYMVHWTLCLKDPQKFFNLLPGSRIAFMQMSTSETQARDVIFGDIFARIKHAKWFLDKYPYDDKFTKQIRFPQKDIWILPGDSAETTFEGYNILGGILDEMDSHKITKDKDYAEVGYTTIEGRITSRFGNRGLLILIGQMKKSSGFAAKKYREYLIDPSAYVTRMTLWESFGWDHPQYQKDGKRDSFFYDIKRRQIIPPGVGSMLTKKESVIEVPSLYLKNFTNGPEKALRDLAGIPPASADPFISQVDRVEDCFDRWVATHGHPEGPVSDNPTDPEVATWVRKFSDPRRHASHFDLAYSSNGDAVGFATGHVDKIVRINGELKPYIVIDLAIRVRARPGQQIMFSDLRNYLYDLRDERGFNIKYVSLDGFQSQDMIQQLRKRRFWVDKFSVDTSTLAYEDLREAINERRLELPPYMTYLNKGDTERVEIIKKELLELSYDGKKVDHPPTGSKDVADAIAAVTSKLMGDRSFKRGADIDDSSVEDWDAALPAFEYQPEDQEVLQPSDTPFPTLWAVDIRQAAGLKPARSSDPSYGPSIPGLPDRLRNR
jgi:hypothetical protein